VGSHLIQAVDEGSTLTIVVHLPQPLDKVVALVRALADEWPDAHFVDGLSRLEVPADG
jgi:hypothetical protein